MYVAYLYQYDFLCVTYKYLKSCGKCRFSATILYNETGCCIIMFGNFKKVNSCLNLIAKLFWILTVRSALVFNIHVAKSYSSVHICTHFKNKHLIRKCWLVNNRAFTVFEVLTDLFPCQQHLLDFTAITCWLFLWSYTLKTYNASPVCKNHKLHYQPKRQRNANTPLSDDMLWVLSLVGDLYIGQTTL